MSPQFVDYNGDGRSDIVVGTFSGSPYVALGTPEGFEQPTEILDRNGSRIVLNQFWNYQDKKWDRTDRCDPKGGVTEQGHGTSAWAMDWDQDGDLDLLLGDYDGGFLYLRVNEGSAKEAKFATRNVRVQAGGKPIKVDKMATMRVIDWTGDGVADLLVGSMGDTYRKDTGGGVFLYPGEKTTGAAKFGAAVTLVTPSPKKATTAVRPDAGLYIDAADHDGDGDLDLIVGGYSIWTQPEPDLSPEQVVQRDALEKEIDRIYQKMIALNRDPEEARSKHKDELRQLADERRELTAQLEPLQGGDKRQTYVWLYENLAIRSRTASL